MFMYIFYISGFIVLLRAVTGPTFADRVIAMNTLINILTFFMIYHAIQIRNELYLDVAIVITMLSFVGTLAISKYIVRKVEW